MRTLKHVGRISKTKENVLVVFRTLPGDSGSALVLPTSGLSIVYHDAVNQLVETIQAQESFEFGEILFTRMFPDGRPMLRALRADGVLQKVPTDQVIMMPNPHDEILLSDLNVLIAEQRNCAIDDLCQFVSGAKASAAANEAVEQSKEFDRAVSEPAAIAPLQANPNEVLSDSDIAKSYRSQAASLFKEAAELRRQADDLDPPKKAEAKPVAKTSTATPKAQVAKPVAKPTTKPKTTSKVV
jgi:hypothetical protein